MRRAAPFLALVAGTVLLGGAARAESFEETVRREDRATFRADRLCDRADLDAETCARVRRELFSVEREESFRDGLRGTPKEHRAPRFEARPPWAIDPAPADPRNARARSGRDE